MPTPPIPISIISPIPVHVLVDNHLSNSDKISIGALGLSLLLIVVTLFLVLADRSMVKQSELAMKHDSLLEVYTVMVAGMRTMRILHEWKIKNTTLEIFTNPLGVPHYRLNKPQGSDYNETPHPKSTVDNFTSQETTARMKLLKNDEISIKVQEWRSQFTLMENDWFSAIPAFEATLNPGTQTNANPYQGLEDIKTRQKHVLDKILFPLVIEITEMMQLKLSAKKS